MDDSKKAIQNIKQALRQLATNGVPVYNMIEAMKDLEEKYAESEDERIIHWIRKELESKYVVDNIVNNEMADKALAWLENIPYAIDHEKREGFRLGYKAGLEKQGEQKPVKLVTILDDYFANTPKEQQDKDWEELKHFNNFGWELVEQKSVEWSDEDEKMRTRCAACLGYHYHDELITRKEYKEAHNWLDSLKDRVQSKQEWSEEDEMMLFSVIWYLRDSINSGDQSIPAGKLEPWIRTLKERVQPQPKQEWSKEDASRMDNLCHFVGGVGNLKPKAL